MKFGLSESQMEILLRLAIEPLKAAGASVWIFGSRARGDQVQFSDVDLLYSFSGKIPQGLISSISENLEDSRLPVKVDLVSEDELAESYRAGVIRERVSV